MTTTLGLRDMPLRLAEIAKASFGYLLDYKRPFFPRSFTLIFTGLLLVLVSAVCVKIIRAKIPFSTRLIDVLLFIVFCYAALIFSFASNFITKTDTLFWPRIDFFGIAYFHIFILAVLFKQRNKFVKNISLLSCFVLIYVCAISAFYAMKVWKLGFDAEKMEWNRIIARIEMTAGYQDDKDYQVIILGSTRAYRPYFYDGKYHQDDMLDHSYMPPWASEWKVRVFYAYTVHSKNGIWLQIDLDSQPGEFKKLIAKMPDEIENAEAWPSLKSIFIKDDLMLIALNQAELDRVKQLLK
jgi:hypothetical protein